MLGIKETKELLVFGLDVGEGVFKSYADDGKITFGDATNFSDAVISVPAALKGVTDVPAELADLDEAEFGEIKDLVVARLPDIGDKWIVVANEALSIGTSIVKIYNVLKG